MKHIVLLGDSIFDNAPYVGNDPEAAKGVYDATTSICESADGRGDAERLAAIAAGKAKTALAARVRQWGR